MSTDQQQHPLLARMACRHCGLIRLHPGMGARLITLDAAVQQATGRGLTITSGSRCLAHNQAVGGHPRSLHVADKPYHQGARGTLAADTEAADGKYRGTLFAIAWQAGWSIGWNARKNFLHLDLRTEIGMSQTTFDY